MSGPRCCRCPPPPHTIIIIISALLYRALTPREHDHRPPTTRGRVFETGLVYHCKFENELWRLLNNERCGTHLFSQHNGGVLLLGTEIPDADGLVKINVDRSQAVSNTKVSYGSQQAASCFNLHTDSRGSFGGM